MKKNPYNRKIVSNKNFEEISYVKWEDVPGDNFFFSLRAYGETRSKKKFEKNEKAIDKLTDYIAIEFIEEGQLSVSFGEKTFHLQKNDLLFYKTDIITIRMQSQENIPMTKKYISVKANRLLLHFLHISEEGFFICHCKHPERVKSIYKSILDLILENGKFLSSDISSNIYKLVYDFFVLENGLIHTPDTFTAIPHTLSISPEKYKDLKSILNEFHTTKYALTKLFRERYNTTPIAYLITLKLNKACWYLENTTTPVNEIARLCGIENVPLFTRQFKKQFSCTPGQYRKIKQKFHNSSVTATVPPAE